MRYALAWIWAKGTRKGTRDMTFCIVSASYSIGWSQTRVDFYRNTNTAEPETWVNLNVARHA